MKDCEYRTVGQNMPAIKLLSTKRRQKTNEENIETDVDRHVECPLLFFEFNQNWCVSAQYEIS
jgi:hypothetical protein